MEIMKLTVTNREQIYRNKYRIYVKEVDLRFLFNLRKHCTEYV